MINRLKAIGHNMIESDKNVSTRVIELGVRCLEMNDLFTEVTKGNDEKLNEVAKKCVEISILSDAIIYDLYVANQISIEELNKTMEEKISKL